MDHSEKLKLYGFNNLTKALSFNIYDVCYAKTPREQKDYIAYIDQQYNSERLTRILTSLTDMIGARVLSIFPSRIYDPQGGFGHVLIAEGSMMPVQGETQVAHLDKSHVTVHTYPEYHPETCLATFRVDIDVATCGEITPLSTLDYLIGSFDSDIITLDYRVRGFTRDVSGKSCLSTMTSRRSRTISTPKFWHVTMPSTSTSIRRTSSTRTCSSKSWICRTTCSTWMPTSFRLRPGWTSAPVCGAK